MQESINKNKFVEFLTKYKFQIILAFVVLIICGFKYWSIKYVPDVFCDESDILNHIKSLVHSAKDANGHKLPFYSKVGAGLTTYAYMYPMSLLMLFNQSAVYARVVQNTLTIVACILTAFAVKDWTKYKWSFWITLIVGLTIPWGFVQSSRIWDPALVPLYFSIHFFFYAKLMKNDIGKIKTYIYSIISYTALVLLAVVYPPCRIPAVCMWIFAVIFALVRKKITWIHLIPIVISCSIFAAPLAYYLVFDKDFNSRSSYLLVFNQRKDVIQALHLWAKNSIGYFNPKFLFVGGDYIDRHALPIFGVLGTISIIPLCVLVKQKGTSLIYYMIGIIIVNNISCGLTNEYDFYSPHALRNCLSWMAYAVLISLGWYHLLKGKKLYVKIIFYSLFAIFFITFFIFYALYYKGDIKLDIF